MSDSAYLRKKLDLKSLGSLAEAEAAAETAAGDYDRVAARVMRRWPDGAPVARLEFLFFNAAVTRARGLHDAAVREIQHANPHAVFPLIRSWAELAALLVYVKDHLEYLDGLSLPKGTQGFERRSAQRLISDARDRIPGLKGIYDELSEFVHFGAKAFWSPFRVEESERGERSLTWTSHPRWHQEDEALLACAWVLELAQATRHLLQEYAEAHLRPPKAT